VEKEFLLAPQETRVQTFDSGPVNVEVVPRIKAYNHGELVVEQRS
jgi:hypothetical protein